ncbi:hypothetical protein BV20DRAFT_1058350 [Pilatotrama ljubarskyi]|nr:hypothetical protein BV20DRAFT_1058417 [Pilatotrama ljubarskyi]KAI0363082.1 hypothetical protein BV20DRAFT_1058350 [Pilatotrama ljubarskyi]
MLTDFSLSRQYSENETTPLEVPSIGADHSVPEFRKDEQTPRNPFPTDVYYLGNMIREDFPKRYSNLAFMYPLVTAMVRKEPQARPHDVRGRRRFPKRAGEIVELAAALTLVVRKDDGLTNLFKGAHDFASQTIPYFIRRLPPMPSPTPNVSR